MTAILVLSRCWVLGHGDWAENLVFGSSAVIAVSLDSVVTLVLARHA